MSKECSNCKHLNKGFEDPCIDCFYSDDSAFYEPNNVGFDFADGIKESLANRGQVVAIDEGRPDGDFTGKCYGRVNNGKLIIDRVELEDVKLVGMIDTVTGEITEDVEKAKNDIDKLWLSKEEVE